MRRIEAEGEAMPEPTLSLADSHTRIDRGGVSAQVVEFRDASAKGTSLGVTPV